MVSRLFQPRAALEPGSLLTRRWRKADFELLGVDKHASGKLAIEAASRF
jgi:hypothetical protein